MRLLAWRRKQGIGQNQFAKAVGIDQSLISKYESGKRRPAGPNIQRIREHTAGEVDLDDWVRKSSAKKIARPARRSPARKNAA